MPLIETGRSSLAALVLGLVLAAPAVQAGPEHAETPVRDEDLGGDVAGARALEGRIRAPCCWTQTLDVHGSEISNELRREIRRRLRAGESSEAIQADIVKRYGDKVLAVPPGNPLKDVAVLLSIGFGAAGVAAGAMLLRWRKRSLLEREQEEKAARAAKKSKKKPEADDLDERIDAELEKL